MSLDGVHGFLDVESAALRAPQVGVANTNPQHILSVGSNLYVSGDSPDVLTVDGNVVCEGVKVGLIEIIPSYDFAAVSNVGNVTQSTIQFANATTGFTTTANIEVGTANLFVDTVTGRVGIGKTDPGAALDVVGDVEISGETVLGTATYRKRRDWDRNALAYVYLGNVTTNNTTGIRLDVSLNNSTTGYQMFNFQITLQGNDASHGGGKLVYSVQGTKNDNISRAVDIGYVYVGSPGSFEYQLWLKDPTTDTTGDMDAYLNCQGYYNFDTGVSDVTQGGAEPTDFQDGVVGVLVDNNGNVGIGTTNPQDVTHIYKSGANGDHGLLIEQNNAGTGSATLKFGVAHTSESTAGLSKAGIFFKRGNTNGRGDLLFCMDNTDDTNDVDTSDAALTIYRDGNVGIGRTNPLSPLDVKAKKGILTAASLSDLYSNASVMITGTAESVDALCIGMLGTDYGGNSGNNPYAYIQNIWDSVQLAQPILLNPAGGNIGIGTTNPGNAKLHIGSGGLHIGGTELRSFSAIPSVGAGVYTKLCDFTALPSTTGGVATIRIDWSNGLGGSTQYYWFGSAVATVAYNTYADGNGTFNGSSSEPVNANQWYHYRTVGPLTFRMDSDNAGGSYGRQSLLVAPSAAISSMSFRVTALPLRR